MKTLSLAVCAIVLLLPGLLLAQDPSRPQLDGLTKAGKLFTIKLTPQDQLVRIDLAGNPAAKIDLKNKQIEVLLIEGSGSRKLKVTRSQDGYFTTEPLTKQKNMELEVKAMSKSEAETFRFRLP